MKPVAESCVSVLVLCLSLLGCGGTQNEPAAPSGSAPAPAVPSHDGGSAARAELTAEACEAGGGTVVGDIGDGAVHRPDYLCPSGVAPTGSIAAPAGGPMGVEGSVCCPK